MEVAHLQPLSLLDYPGKTAAVAWTVGCNLRCPFCYNAELVLPELGRDLPRLPGEEVAARLEERVGFLEGVVVTGGEPTLHSDLVAFIGRLKEAGFFVKLDTNGTHPHVLRVLLADGLVDYVALDVKAPFARYPEFTGLRPSDHGTGELAADLVARVQESIALVRDRAPDYEFRTTVAPGLAPDDLLSIAHEIRGARRYVLQPFFVPDGKRLVDEAWPGRPALSLDPLRALLPELRKLVSTELRG